MSASAFLVVDDDDTFATALARSLTRRGFPVDVAADAERARECCRAREYGFACVDLKMDGETGLELIPWLRRNQPGVRILMLTGYASIATTVEAVKRGADNYLAKPAGVTDILAALQADDGGELPPDGTEPAPMSVRRREWEYIQRVLLEHNGNISATARVLGMHRRTLQRKLDKFPVRR